MPRQWSAAAEGVLYTWPRKPADMNVQFVGFNWPKLIFPTT